MKRILDWILFIFTFDGKISDEAKEAGILHTEY